MITPRPRFTKLYETLTPEKRHATDYPRTRCGLPASQDQRRIYIYIYTLWSSATGSPKAQQRGLQGSQYRPIPEAPRLGRPPCGSRLARDAGQHARCHGWRAATRWEPAGNAKSQRKITAVLHDRRAPPCYKTDISKM